MSEIREIIGNTTATPNPLLDVENKLDKTSEANKMYGTDAEGNQVNYAISERQTAGVAMRDAEGQIELPSVPTRSVHAASKGYVDTVGANKVDKINTAWILYGTGYNAAPTHYFVSEVPDYASVVVKRDGNKDVLVPEIPSSNSGATSKKYVDDKNNELAKRVSNLESLTLTYTQDKTTAYEKSVPAEVATPAFIKEIGGATEKVTSKNIINPETIDVYVDHEGDPVKLDKTVDADGFIYFTIDPYADDGGVNGFIQLSELPNGRYYLLLDGDGYYTSNGMIDFSVKWGDNPLLTEFKTRVMVYKFEDASDVEILPAPEGTVFEAYHEPYFQHAEVERIESIGANLIPFPYVYGNKVMNVGYKETKNGVTFEVLENGLISAKGTATSQATFWIFSKTMPTGNYYLGSVQPNYGTEGIVVASYTNANGGNNGSGYTNQKIPHYNGKLDVYLSVYSGKTINVIFEPILTRGAYSKDFKPFSANPIDTFELPVEAIKARVDSYGIDKNYIQVTDNSFEFVQTKKKVILNSTVGTWEAFSSVVNSNGYYIYYLVLDNKKVGFQTSNCVPFENKDAAYTNGIAGQYTDHPSLPRVYFCANTHINTLEKWKALLDEKEANGNPVILEYDLATPIITDITDLFTKDEIEIEQGGVLRFVNENEMSVPNNIVYVTRKG